MYRNGANGNGNGGAAGGAAGAEAEDTTATTGYSLEALSKELVPTQAKSASMKELFGVKRRVPIFTLWSLCGVCMYGIMKTHIRVIILPLSNLTYNLYVQSSTLLQQAHAHDHPHLTLDTHYTHTTRTSCDRSKRKDGSEGNMVKIPELRDVQRDPATRLKWIGYSALDAK